MFYPWVINNLDAEMEESCRMYCDFLDLVISYFRSPDNDHLELIKTAPHTYTLKYCFSMFNVKITFSTGELWALQELESLFMVMRGLIKSSSCYTLTCFWSSRLGQAFSNIRSVKQFDQSSLFTQHQPWAPIHLQYVKNE